ncbi:O-antigen ligase [Mycobacterium sp. PS03-16]|uniref:O-antigen ligase family protein n=1 Tax=Mycobacterium sp. PS03-16 TaxID=2559611 RepID=UPI0014313057|nr:O-antigen ligase family protein [Mycobacterium sp. PS03-16]
MVFYYLYVACIIGANAAILIPRTAMGHVESNQLFSASWVALHVVSLLVLLSLLRRQDSRNLVFVAMLGILILVSAIWSVAPTYTLLYGGMMVGNVLVAHLMASELTFEEIVSFLTRVILVISVVGVVAYFLRFGPVYYFDVHQRPNIFGGQPFRGFTAHKILAGLYATLGAVAVMTTTRGAVRVACMSVLALSVALTSSMIGIVLFLAATPIYVAVRYAFARRVGTTAMFVGSGAAILVVVFLVASYWEQMLGVLARDSTLTGRTTLWHIGVNAWLERPLLGWGFNAYLESSFSGLANRLFNPYGEWDIPHFHQSFIQTAVDMGALGLAILIGVLVYTLIASYRYGVAVNTSTGAFGFVVTLLMVIAATAMFIFFNYNHFGTFLLMLLFFSLRRANRVGGEAEVSGGPSFIQESRGLRRTSKTKRRIGTGA